MQKEAETERGRRLLSCGGHQAPTPLWRKSGTHTIVKDIRHPLPTVSVHLYSLPYSTFKSLHTDSLLRENESEQARTILSTGSEQPKIKYLYLIWSLRIESQLLSVCAANGQRNRVSNLCVGFSSFTAWMDTTRSGAQLQTSTPLASQDHLGACSFTLCSLCSRGKDCEASPPVCLPQGQSEGHMLTR